MKQDMELQKMEEYAKRVEAERTIIFQKRGNKYFENGIKKGFYVRLNLTENTFIEQQNRGLTLLSKDTYDNADEVYEEVRSKLLLENEKAQFCAMFGRTSLLQSYEDGHEKSAMIASCVLPALGRFVFRLIGWTYRNAVNGDIESYLYVVDYTDAQLGNDIQLLLYDKNYTGIGILDLKHNALQVRKGLFEKELSDKKFGQKHYDYDAYSKELVQLYQMAGERAWICHMLSRERIRQELSHSERYINTFPCTIDGKSCVIKIQYRWYLEPHEVALMTVEDITEVAEQDVVTGINNRTGFFNKVQGLLERQNQGNEYALLYFNLKGFKMVNYLVGTEGGDWVLKQFVEILMQSFLHPVLIGRVGGDRFTCLIRTENLLYSRLRELCDCKMNYLGTEIKVRSVLGIYLIDDQTMKINDMYDNAKMASSHIKDEYIRPYENFKPEMRANYLDGNQIVADFERALAEDEFEVYLQPIFSPKTGKIVSAEALIRWHYHKEEMISPAAFIPVLEENGQISQLDFYVVRKVRERQKQRAAENKPLVPVSVNLSWMDFYDENMMKWIIRDMNESSEISGYIRYEITETSYAAVAENRSEIINNLRELGGLILLDDFGSGYSSFSMLQEYDFDILKLDKGFVDKIGINEKTELIIRYLIEMTHQMGIKVIAEGAEREEQVRFLRKNACDYIQGFFYSRPLPLVQFDALFDKIGKSEAE